MVVKKRRAGLTGCRPSPVRDGAAELSVTMSRRVMQLSRAQVAMRENHRAAQAELHGEPPGVAKRPARGR